MKNVALTSCYGYNWKEIEVTVKSFRKTCPDDDMFVFFYSMPSNETFGQLIERNVNPVLVRSSRPDRIVVERFYAYSAFLSQNNYKYAVCVDAADIFFQRNPFEWIQSRIGESEKVIVGSEQLLYKDEPWGRGNLKDSFPTYFDSIKDCEIGNAGSIGGSALALSRICKRIHDLSINNQVFNPDQAALNVLMRQTDVESFIFTTPDDGWSYQCGTAANDKRGDHKEYNYNTNLIGSPPRIHENKIVNRNGEAVCIVHQYHHNDALSKQIKESLL